VPPIPPRPPIPRRRRTWRRRRHRTLGGVANTSPATIELPNLINEVERKHGDKAHVIARAAA
jgi:hypothetical protein